MNINRRMTLLSLFIATVIPSLSYANDEICADIQKRLNGGTLTIGNNAETRAITRAINDQNALVRQIRIDMRRNGCSIGSVIVYGNQNAEFCGELGDHLVEARAELDYLTSQRSKLQLSRQSSLPDDERRALEDDWDYYGCSRANAVQLPPPDLSIPQVVGRDPSPLDPSVTIIAPTKRPANPQTSTQGSLRTVCVRLCDGKFFPISNNATPLDFSSQSQQCNTACPGSQTELYYHSLIGQETRDMISTVTGKRYAELPTAFRFQSMGKTRDSTCGCGPVGSVEFEEKPEEAAKLQPPIQKIEPNSAPQTQSKQSSTEPNEGRPYVPGERKVRSVGPQFFPQDNAMDLTNPAVKGAQPQQ